MFARPNQHMPFDKPVFTGTFYINTDKVDKLWEHLRETTSIVCGIENFDWGMREFAIYDNNDYIL
jgi:hypothetical protein